MARLCACVYGSLPGVARQAPELPHKGSTRKRFSDGAEIFGDPVAVAALVHRLVHHAEVLVLRGDSYRLKGREVLQGEVDG